MCPRNHVKGKFVNKGDWAVAELRPMVFHRRRKCRAESADHIGAACEGVLIAVTAECRDLANSLGPVRKWVNFRRMRRLGLRARQYGYRYQQFESRSLRHDLCHSVDYGFHLGESEILPAFRGFAGVGVARKSAETV